MPHYVIWPLCCTMWYLPYVTQRDMPLMPHYVIYTLCHKMWNAPMPNIVIWIWCETMRYAPSEKENKLWPRFITRYKKWSLLIYIYLPYYHRRLTSKDCISVAEGGLTVLIRHLVRWAIHTIDYSQLGTAIYFIMLCERTHEACGLQTLHTNINVHSLRFLYWRFLGKPQKHLNY